MIDYPTFVSHHDPLGNCFHLVFAYLLILSFSGLRRSTLCPIFSACSSSDSNFFMHIISGLLLFATFTHTVFTACVLCMHQTQAQSPFVISCTLIVLVYILVSFFLFVGAIRAKLQPWGGSLKYSGPPPAGGEKNFFSEQRPMRKDAQRLGTPCALGPQADGAQIR